MLSRARTLEEKWFERVAYREAGRAVAASSLGMPFSGVTILPRDIARRYTPSGASARGARYRGTLEWKDRERIDAEIVIAYCAPAAEAALAGPRNLVAARVEHDNTRELASSICESDEEKFAYLAWLEIRARNLVTEPKNWRAVQRLAAALIERKEMGESDARKLIKGASAKQAARRR